MARPSPFEFAGGTPAFLRLAAAHQRRCLDDPVLNHPSHPGHPQPVERLAGYSAEALGGSATYSGSCGGHSAMLEIHARMQAENELGSRFVD